MGYPITLFLDSEQVNEEFICSICQDVLQDVMMTHRCEHVFCKSCIEHWLATSPMESCPIDRKLVHRLKKPQRVFINLLNGLQLHCSFQDFGCGAVVKLGDFEQHKANCAFNPEVSTPCPGGCGLVLLRRQLGGHSCIAYLKQQVGTLKHRLDFTQGQLQIIQGELVEQKVRCKDLEDALAATAGSGSSRHSRAHNLYVQQSYQHAIRLSTHIVVKINGPLPASMAGGWEIVGTLGVVKEIHHNTSSCDIYLINKKQIVSIPQHCLSAVQPKVGEDVEILCGDSVGECGSITMVDISEGLALVQMDTGEYKSVALKILGKIYLGPVP